MHRFRSGLIWLAFLAAIAVPIALAAVSPLLAWRSPVYIAGGFAGVIALALLLAQPTLAAGYLPGLATQRGRRVHRWVGAGLVLAVVVHVAALWITSPPDMVDALLLSSPTPFSAWGVIAMWAIFAAALVAGVRRRLKIHPATWRRIHTSLTALVVVATVVHAMMIQGTMEVASKAALCVLVLAMTLLALIRLRIWALWSPRKRKP